MAAVAEASSVTHEGVTIRSNEGQTSAELLAELGVDAEAPVESPAETPEAPADPDEPAKEPPKAAGDRNADGTFKPKAAAPTKAEKAKKDPQERIDRITWEREEVKREAAALRERIAALERQTPPPATAKPTPPTVTVDQVIARPNIAEPPISEQEFFQRFPEAPYSYHGAYLARYYGAIDQAQHQMGQVQHARAQAMSRVEATAHEKHPDFQDVAAAALHQGVRFVPHVADFILQHPLGHDVAYELLKQPDELRKISFLPPLAAAVELGRLVSRLEAAPVTGPAPKAPISKASPPPKPVGASPTATDDPPGDDASDAEHDAYWAKQRRKYR